MSREGGSPKWTFSNWLLPVQLRHLSESLHLHLGLPVAGAMEPSGAWGWALLRCLKQLMEYRTPVDFLASLMRRWPPPISGSLPGLQWFFSGIDSTLSGSKKFFLGPFVSFMIGICLGLQSTAAYTVWPDGRADSPGYCSATATHSLFQFKQNSGSYLQNRILSRFSPDSYHRVHSVNSHSHTMWCPDGLPQRPGRFVQCTSAWGLGGLCSAPSKGLSAWERCAFFVTWPSIEAAFYVIYIKALLVLPWPELVGVAHFSILIMSSGSQPRFSMIFVLPTVSPIHREKTDHPHVS